MIPRGEILNLLNQTNAGNRVLASALSHLGRTDFYLQARIRSEHSLKKYGSEGLYYLPNRDNLFASAALLTLLDGGLNTIQISLATNIPSESLRGVLNKLRKQELLTYTNAKNSINVITRKGEEATLYDIENVFLPNRDISLGFEADRRYWPLLEIQRKAYEAYYSSLEGFRLKNLKQSTDFDKAITKEELSYAVPFASPDSFLAFNLIAGLFYRHKHSRVQATDLAEELSLPLNIVKKLIETLKNAGILFTSGGKHGGVQFRHNLEDISIFDVQKAIEKQSVLPSLNYMVDEETKHIWQPVLRANFIPLSEYSNVLRSHSLNDLIRI